MVLESDDNETMDGEEDTAAGGSKVQQHDDGPPLTEPREEGEDRTTVIVNYLPQVRERALVLVQA